MLCRLVGKGHNMPVPLHLETKWYIAILAQGQRGGKEFLLPLELACWGPSVLAGPAQGNGLGQWGAGDGHQRWCLSTPPVGLGYSLTGTPPRWSRAAAV